MRRTTISVDRWLLLCLLSAAVCASAVGQVAVLRVDGDDGLANGDGGGWGPDAFKYLQDGLATAELLAPFFEQVQVWVAKSRAENPYLPDRNASNPTGTGDQSSTFTLVNKVALFGGFRGFDDSDPNNPYLGESQLKDRNPERNVTILSGNIGSPSSSADNCYHVVSAISVVPTAVLNGFVVRDGNANGPGLPGGIGGGLYGYNSRPTLCRIRFVQNVARQGGAIHFSGPDQGRGLIVNCTFEENTAVEDQGGAIHTIHAKFSLVNCVFLNNSAAGHGGGLALPESHDEVSAINCTFVGNTSVKSGAGAYTSDQLGEIEFWNCIFWGNLASGVPSSIIDESYDSSVTVDYSDVQGGWTGSGTNNINADPLFCNAAVGNLQLEDTSPCVGGGSNAIVPGDDANVDDDPATTTLPWDRGKFSRVFPVLGTVDMGAFENAHTPACVTDLDGDGWVGIFDLAQFLSCYGQPAEGSCAAADFDCDGFVGLSDLTTLLASYGSCGFSFSRSSGANENSEEAAFFEWAQQASIEELLDWHRALQGESR